MAEKLVAPSLADIELLAQTAWEALPDAVKEATRDVAIVVEDFASDMLLADMGMDTPFELTGVYQGIPITEKSVMDQPIGPDQVTLFRRAILDEWIERGNEELGALVAHILVHELAHHLGWSDDDIASIDRWWE